MRNQILLAATLPLTISAAPVRPADLLIRGGTVFTGSQAPFVGDVAVRGDRIVSVGPGFGDAGAARDRCEGPDRRARLHRSAHAYG